MITIDPAKKAAIDAARAVRVVTRRQFMMALYVWGLTDRAAAAVDASGGITKVAWDGASEFKSDDPMLVSLASSIGLDGQISEFFDFAASL